MSWRSPSNPQRSSLGRTAARAQAAAAEAAPAPAAQLGDLVAVCGRGAICTRNAATRSPLLVKNPENANDCDKETGRGCLVRVQFERLCVKAGWRSSPPISISPLTAM